MTDEEKTLICEFAKGNKSLRDEAIRIHRKYIPTLGVRGTLTQRFMAEVDHPSFDGAMCDMYKRQLLAS